MTIRFAFKGRCSTEDQQDPETSRAWQLTRAKALIEPHGGQVVAEYFDAGQSRSMPWQRRPQARALLDGLKNPNREFDAVVIGEPQREFYGNQFGNTFPLFVHYDIPLWVPEVGGPIDPNNEAHDLIMSVFGGMSKGERNRIKVRVRTAMAALAVMEGRFLGGRPPYGYRLVDLGEHPNPAKAADGKRLHGLEPDSVTSPVVERIFAEYLAGYGVYAIAERLTREGIACPSAHDPARNRHRCGVAWSKGAVRAILGNPRYTGRQVWNKQHKHEVLMDVEDVALGHVTKMRWNAKDTWLWSERPAHAAIITIDTFEQVQQRLASRGPRTAGRVVTTRARHPYALRGRLWCGDCDRRMQGSWNHGRAHYRCRFPTEYALANKISHPRTLYLREDAVLDPLDTWLASAFHPEHINQTLTALTDAPTPTSHDEQLARELAACDRKMAQHRAALEAGADPATVTTWINQTRAERDALQARLNPTQPTRRRLSREQIAALVTTLGDLIAVLREADPDDKAEIYRQLGLKLTYHPDRKTVQAEARPSTGVCVLAVSEGGLEPPRPLEGTSTSS